MAGSIGEAARVAREAGFQGDKLVMALAIAGAESGWRSDAIAKDDGGPGYPSVGYWQINTHAHYDKIPGASVADKTAALVSSPGLQASLAWQISGGGENWRPWTVFRTGAYRANEAEARGAVDASDATGRGADNRLDTVIAYVNAQVGKPYVWGGGRDGDDDNFDCSGLMLSAYQQVGVQIGGDAWEQSRTGETVESGGLGYAGTAMPGDLLFFNGRFPWDGTSQEYRAGPEHVGMYVGDGMMVDARGRAYGVVKRPVPWPDVVGVKRYITDTTQGARLPGIPNPLAAADAFVDLAAQGVKLGAWVMQPRNQVRLIVGGMAAVGVLVGLVLMAAASKPAATVTRTAGNVAQVIPHPAAQAVAAGAKGAQKIGVR